MKRILSRHFSLIGVLLISLFLAGCEEISTRQKEITEDNATVSNTRATPITAGDKNNPQVQEKEAEGKQAKIGKNVYLEVFPGDRRRVLVHGYVCRREGELEQLMCLKLTKEHEAILAADCDARKIHLALIAAKATPGSPVKFVPKFQAANGTTIKVSLRYQDKKGKTVTVPAQKWVRHFQTKKELHYDWVFAGSQFMKNFDPNLPDRYAANDGDVICLSNFETAMLDLPVVSSKEAGSLVWQANTEVIPPENTPVVIILEPVQKK